MFISAQTGQGKNFFIENKLIPYVRELNRKNNTNQRVLIISNRLALKRQVKNRIEGNVDNDGSELIYNYNEFVDVITYQSIIYLRNKFKITQKKKNAAHRYIYVICDEAHFFSSDAMFNPNTERILFIILEVFQSAIRVYMSATPYECIHTIREYEEEWQYRWDPYDKKPYDTMISYHFQRNYDYLNLKAYSNIKELYQIIVAGISNREKWLIFIDNKELCQKVKNEIIQCYTGENSNSQKDISDRILAVDANSKNDPKFMEIILGEKLGKNTDVLITTSVLDNGVNLSDINNIVISDMNMVKCLQMVGRARVKNVDDKKTLYIKRFNAEYVKRRIMYGHAQEDAYHSFDLAYGNNSSYPLSGADAYRFFRKYYDGTVEDWENAKHWFGRELGLKYDKTNPYDREAYKLYKNEIAESLLQRFMLMYKRIYDDMLFERQESDIPGEKPIHEGQKYLEFQFSWFRKKYCIDDDVTFADKEKSKKELIAFLEEYAVTGRQIDKENQMVFREKFTKLSDVAFGRMNPNKDRVYSRKKINAILVEKGINYHVVSNSPYWSVKAFDWGEDEA